MGALHRMDGTSARVSVPVSDVSKPQRSHFLYVCEELRTMVSRSFRCKAVLLTVDGVERRFEYAGEY